MEYYTRRRNLDSLSISSNSSRSVSEESSVEDDALAAAFERSIYLFPSPPSAPLSPAPSLSHTSASAVISSPPFSPSVSRERRLTGSSSATGTSAGGWEDIDTPLSLRPSDAGSPLPDSDRLGLSERNDWDWSPMDEAEASMLEEEIVRASRWDMAAALRRRVDSLADAEARRRAQQQLQQSLQSKQIADDILESRRTSYVRSRTTSAATAYGLGSAPGPTPHPRIHLPLLSFFASLLSLDSSTLHLLSHTPALSILFPGASSSIVGDSPHIVEDTDRPHGMESLFAPASERTSVKEGIDVVCDEDIVSFNPFLVSPFGLTSIIGIVKVMWPGERWRTRVWGPSQGSDKS